MKRLDNSIVDQHVHRINDLITPQIDCTACGNCCKSLMINVTSDEVTQLSLRLNLTEDQVKDKHIETSLQGQMIMNTIPCHFLSRKSCTIYEDRFAECREFPHLHKNNFTARLFATIQYYQMCPIIFNVIENLKICLDFKDV